MNLQCRFGIHNWSLWLSRRIDAAPFPGKIAIQYQVCKRCGKERTDLFNRPPRRVGAWEFHNERGDV